MKISFQLAVLAQMPVRANGKKERRMALARKGSRAIHVDGIDYRWALSPDSGYSVLIVQHAQANGSKLTIYITPDEKTAGSAEETEAPVTPSLVSELIRQALELGWPSTARTLDFVCDLNPGPVLAHRG
jgi:hypothetical protein